MGLRARAGLGAAVPAALLACASPADAPVPDASDAGVVDADAADPARVATGTRIVDGPAIVAGLTSDGYVGYSNFDADGRTVANVVRLDGSHAGVPSSH